MEVVDHVVLHFRSITMHCFTRYLKEKKFFASGINIVVKQLLWPMSFLFGLYVLNCLQVLIWFAFKSFALTSKIE